MFTKILLVALIIIILLMWWRHSTIQRLKHEMMQRPGQKPPTRIQETTMVRCGACGIYLPVDEALSRGNDYYCCPEHAKKGSGR